MVVVGERDGVVRLLADGSPWQVGVLSRQGPPRRASCGDETAKPGEVHEVVAAGPGTDHRSGKHVTGAPRGGRMTHPIQARPTDPGAAP